MSIHIKIDSKYFLNNKDAIKNNKDLLDIILQVHKDIPKLDTEFYKYHELIMYDNKCYVSFGNTEYEVDLRKRIRDSNKSIPLTASEHDVKSSIVDFILEVPYITKDMVIQMCNWEVYDIFPDWFPTKEIIEEHIKRCKIDSNGHSMYHYNECRCDDC